LFLKTRTKLQVLETQEYDMKLQNTSGQSLKNGGALLSVICHPSFRTYISLYSL